MTSTTSSGLRSAASASLRKVGRNRLDQEPVPRSSPGASRGSFLNYSSTMASNLARPSGPSTPA